MNAKKLAVIALILAIAVPIAMGYALSFDEVDTEKWETSQSVNISDLLLNSTTDYYGNYTGISNNNNLSGQPPAYVKTSDVVTSYPFTESKIHNLSANTWHTITYNSWYTVIPYGASFGYILDGDSPTYYTPYSNLTVSYKDNTFTIGKSSIPATSVQIQLDRSIALYEIATTGYADVSYGWKIPANTPVTWSNDHDTVEYTLAVKIPSGDTVSFGRVDIRNVSGSISASYHYPVPVPDPEPAQTLGKYNYVLVSVGVDSVTISGLADWPAMGINPKTYNSIEIKNVSNTFSPVITDLNGNAIFRVESATVVAGQFPSTKDLDFDLSTLYPSGSYSVKFNSIGIYGDSLQINGVNYPVDNGKISINGKSVNLKGATIQSILDNGVYHISINGTKVADAIGPLKIRFNGEWSLTAVANIMELTTSKNMQWVPGEFGLDQDGFIACGLLTSAFAFVALGMTGKLSGSKIAVLAFVCGSAIIVYLLIA